MGEEHPPRPADKKSASAVAGAPGAVPAASGLRGRMSYPLLCPPTGQAMLPTSPHALSVAGAGGGAAAGEAARRYLSRNSPCGLARMPDEEATARRLPCAVPEDGDRSHPISVADTAPSPGHRTTLSLPKGSHVQRAEGRGLERGIMPVVRA
jgi:hypothetical protein